MTVSTITIIAQVFGPVAIVAALGLLSNQTRLKKIIDEVSSNEALQFFVNVARTLAGLFIFTSIVDTTDPVHLGLKMAAAVATIVGTFGLVFPAQVAQAFKRNAKDLSLVNVCLVVQLVLGIALMYIGYAL